MSINSRQKGNRGEREVVRILKKHFAGKFERKSMGIPGPDILCPPHWIYAIEVKNDKAVKAVHLLGRPNKHLDHYWLQASAQADALDQVALLVVKADGVWFCKEIGEPWVSFESWCERSATASWNIPKEPVQCRAE